ncbi:MAG TPA: class I SAM-dependent RNA methyltransferase [Blastocatellia bacterium]|nr:class I SAM-dependent RNA methyltransferase [Blastocatellia bacterium]
MIEVEVEKVVYGGDGLARHGGRVLLIRGAAPGDRLRVKIIAEKADYARAEITEIVVASPERRPPPCPYYGRCGGCQLQHLRYEAQLRAKVAMIKESLARIAGLHWTDEIHIIPSEEFHYRLRAELKVDAAGDRVRLGYYQPSSHILCEVDRCPLLSPALNHTLSQLRSYPAGAFAGVRAIDLAQSEEGRVAVHPPPRFFPTGTFSGESNAGSSGPFVEPASGSSPMPTPERQELFSPCELVWRVGGYIYGFDVRTFFQANRFLLPELLNLVVAGEEGERALDLFCGVGFFTMPLAERFALVLGIDSDARAIGHARRNARLNRLSRCRFEAAPVEAWLLAHFSEMVGCDLVVLDPPRMGLTRHAGEALARLQPRRIIYVSCNPATLARDVKRLLQHGYDIVSITALDLFPQTFHVETVVRLRR